MVIGCKLSIGRGVPGEATSCYIILFNFDFQDTHMNQITFQKGLEAEQSNIFFPPDPVL